MRESDALSDADRATYAWQLDVPGFGEEGQRKLRGTTALVSRIGGLGGPLAMQLAAAGIGRLILVHRGDLREDDLNRQSLMAREWIGRPRVECARETLRRFKPEIEVEAVNANMTTDNAGELVGRADIVFDCAPLFEERFLMNAECVRQGVPLIDCAMFNLEGQVLPVIPGETPCLACLYPETPEHWKRRFPVIGAVSALVSSIGAMEGMKLLAGFGIANAGRLIFVDASAMTMSQVRIARRSDCKVCGNL